MKVLAVIPCRSGSKSIKDKNIINLFGYPLLAYSIRFAQKCNFINKIIVSTDSKKYVEISKKFGQKVFFRRPKSISKDSSLDVDVFKHALKFAHKKLNFRPDVVINLRPTSPLRNEKDLKKMLAILKKKKEISSVRSISLSKITPYKMWSIDEKKRLRSIIKNNTKFKEPFNSPRQMLPKFYLQTAVYDIVRSEIVLKENSMSGKNILGYITKNYIDIDTEEDLRKISSNEKKDLLKIIKK